MGCIWSTSWHHCVGWHRITTHCLNVNNYDIVLQLQKNCDFHTWMTGLCYIPDLLQTMKSFHSIEIITNAPQQKSCQLHQIVNYFVVFFVCLFFWGFFSCHSSRVHLVSGLNSLNNCNISSHFSVSSLALRTKWWCIIRPSKVVSIVLGPY